MRGGGEESDLITGYSFRSYFYLQLPQPRRLLPVRLACPAEGRPWKSVAALHLDLKWALARSKAAVVVHQPLLEEL